MQIGESIVTVVMLTLSGVLPEAVAGIVRGPIEHINYHTTIVAEATTRR